MSIKITHAGVGVRNMDEAIAWYGENLGLRLVSRKTFDFMDNMEIAFLDLDGFQVELFCSPNPKEAPAGIYGDNSVIGMKHLAFEVDDLETVLAAMIGRGVEVIFRTGMEGDKVCFVKDCCGTPVELIERGAGKRA